MGITALTSVIQIDETKCINCYACITACPVKYCMDGSGDKLRINPDLCIGCGNCITACAHHARLPVDDTPHFLGDLKQGCKMIAIVAPAIASCFPDQYLNVNGWLKSMGVAAVFDVGFGAELTAASYAHYLKAKNPRLCIAQPCPAIVTFIETYHPELLPYLAPADSPMLHSIKMIREYHPQYNGYKIAVISPCIAKRREFDETRLGDYNITMTALKNLLEARHINLSTFPKQDYTGALAERAVLLPTPGGLMETAERFVPGIRRRTRKIEGVHTIYPYLAEIAELLNKSNVNFPQMVDCLNCEKGCNGGPGTGNGNKPLDELETPVRKRSAEMEEHYNPKQRDKLHKKLHALVNQYWKPGLYNRTYRDTSGNNTLKQPNEAEIAEVYSRMNKFGPHDIYDCTACGYGSCKAMAIAIFNKLNKPENCAHYTRSLLEEEKKGVTETNRQLKDHITEVLGLIEGIDAIVNDLNVRIGSQAGAVDESAAVTEKMVSSLKDTSELFSQKQEAINKLIENADRGRQSMLETIRSVQSISQSMDGVGAAIKIISGIAANTNLLGMNAAIEAAHAGAVGRGFAVVADEIRRLSETTRENSRGISQTLSGIVEGINITSKRSNDTDGLINEMAAEISDFAGTMSQLINILGELSEESAEITGALAGLRGHTDAVKNDYAGMLSMTEKLRMAMTVLASASAPGTVDSSMSN